VSAGFFALAEVPGVAPEVGALRSCDACNIDWIIIVAKSEPAGIEATPLLLAVAPDAGAPVVFVAGVAAFAAVVGD
jgi:hypothetical protein